MFGYDQLIFTEILLIIGLFSAIFASLVENVFFTLRINFSNDAQRKNITNFMEQYHLKYVCKNNEIRLEKGLLSVIVHLFKYRNLSRRFFNGPQIVENAYFQVLYEKNNITVTNKCTNKSIVNINHKDEIWDMVVENISEFFDENQLIEKLEELGYITDKQAVILKTVKKSKSCHVCISESNNYKRNRRRILDVNNCTTEQFDSLPGVTFIIAKKLVKYRSENNGFNSVADFWNVSGLSMRQRIIIEKTTVIKAKRLKHKSMQSNNIILRAIERIVDL